MAWAGLLPYARLVEGTEEEWEEIEPEDGVRLEKQTKEKEPRMPYDRSLLSCLVDRWRPETHTFHFPWGEMAPTLQDVSMLLGLPLKGEAIGPEDPPDDWHVDMPARFAGVLLDPDVEWKYDKHGPRYAWLSQYQVIPRFILVHHYSPFASSHITKLYICYIPCRFRSLDTHIHSWVSIRLIDAWRHM